MTSSCWADATRGDATAAVRSATKRRIRRTVTSSIWYGSSRQGGGDRPDGQRDARMGTARRTRAHRLSYVRLRVRDCWSRTTGADATVALQADRTTTPRRRCAEPRPSVLRDFLQLELVEHGLRVGIAAREGARELVFLLRLQLRRQRRHVAVDYGVDHEGAVARQCALPRARDLIRSFDANAVESEQAGVIGVSEIGDRLGRRVSRVALHHALLPGDVAQISIVQDQHD